MRDLRGWRDPSSGLNWIFFWHNRDVKPPPLIFWPPSLFFFPNGHATILGKKLNFWEYDALGALMKFWVQISRLCLDDQFSISLEIAMKMYQIIIIIIT